jgi:excisionase family DNA binding protein
MRKNEPEMLTTEQLADMLHCSTRTVQRMAASGRLPGSVRVGNLVRWPRPVIEAWVRGAGRRSIMC